ncbi:hypothetical protein [Kitasatospora sp. NPDC050543]|uniref:hypothetical protein n=1 Tax=Kitasatospora sp. NPDC050543 TaxID=3364054 RepID=UPI00379055F9
MAKIKEIGTVTVELTVAELDIVRRALHLVEMDDDRPARDLLADLSQMPGGA